MKDFNSLIKKTFKELSKKNISATPENYENEFFHLCKKDETTLKEKIDFEELVRNLSANELHEFENYQIQSFKKLSHVLSKRIGDDEIKDFLKNLSYFMSPSLSKDTNKEIEELCIQLSENPNNLINNNTIRKLRQLTDVRLENDSTLFNDKNTDVIKLIDFLSTFFEKSIKENYITIKKVKEIKDEINSLELSESSTVKLEELNKKLIDTIESFEKTVNENSLSLLESQKEKNKLEKEIKKLKENLVKAEEEKSIDYLTGVLTRRAYTIEIKRIENEYNIFDSNYAIVFYDLDYFKKINDTYGHDCGDNVLKTFASILNKLTRSEDLICRYGGEEFICIVHYKNTMELSNYLKRVKNIINNNKFVFNETKLDVKFSAGVAFRSNYTSYDEAIKAADIALYKAKNTGRDKVILDDGNVFL